MLWPSYAMVFTGQPSAQSLHGAYVRPRFFLATASKTAQELRAINEDAAENTLHLT